MDSPAEALLLMVPMCISVHMSVEAVCFGRLQVRTVLGRLPDLLLSTSHDGEDAESASSGLIEVWMPCASEESQYQKFS
jgi:hypothetical protein